MLYVRIIFAAACPIIASVLLYLCNKKTAFVKISNRIKQLIYGLIFGALAVLGSEFGIRIEGAVINARDAAPLCAGLIFGAPAGIIAGLIGGAERWFAVYWGAGTYTRLACSLSTCIAGFFGAILRKWMFDDKKPSWLYGFAVGFVMEVLHMLMIFFTNMDEVHTAFLFVQRCSAPMILLNACSVMLSVLAVSLLGKEKQLLGKEHRKLTQTFSRWLSVVVLVAFAITGVFTYILQTSFSMRDSENLLRLNMQDVKADVIDASDSNLLDLTKRVAAEIDLADTVDNSLVQTVFNNFVDDLSEINVIDENGIIFCTTNSQYQNFDMAMGTQSDEFLVLLNGQKSEFVQEYQPVAYDSSISMKYAGVVLEKGGFVQVGYNSEKFSKDINSHIIGATRNRHVGENGYMIIAGEDWNIVSDPNGNEGKNLSETGIWIDKETMPERDRFKTEVYGVNCFCMYTFSEGYYIIAVEPESEVLFSRDLSVYVTVFMEVLVFAAVFSLIYFLIKKLVVKNIHEINHSLKEITGGNLNVSVDVRTNEEFISLSDDINSTVVTLKGYIAEAAARLDKELEVAKIIQSSTLPNVFPPYPERTDLDIFATMETAKEVGGDFYDFYLLDKNRLAFLIADVSGKGITAAMFMMKAKTLIKSYAEKEPDPSKILTLANEALCEGNDAQMFVTCWFGILNFTTNTVSFANAGHNPPLIRRHGKSFEYFKARPGFVLGGMDGIHYRQDEFQLYPGDEIYLYTDGVTEATNLKNELFGDERLLDTVNMLKNATAEELCRKVKDAVDEFAGEASQFDDITMLSLRLLPKNIITLNPLNNDMEKAAAFVEGILSASDVPVKIAMKINIAVDEIYSNIIRYSGADEAEIECSIQDSLITLVFIDNGKPYDPMQTKEPDIEQSADEREIGGLGIFMVKQFMDSVSYSYRDNRNILTLTKTI